MKFDPPLIETRLVKRYKRFLADVKLPDGSVITVHCPNPGSMLGLTDPGNRAWISDSRNPKRKLRHTLELMEIGKTLVGVNTNRPNQLAREAVEAGLIPQFSGFDRLRTEVKYGTNSRIDILLECDGSPDIFVEVKNVHFVRKPNLHEFPDSVTLRGAKHLDEMAAEVKNGNRAAMLYIIQRNDGDRMRIASDLDPNYAAAFNRAVSSGVETYAITCRISPLGIDATDVISLDVEV